MPLDLSLYKLTIEQESLFYRLHEEFLRVSDLRVLMTVCAKKTYEKCVAFLPNLEQLVAEYDLDRANAEDAMPILEMCHCILPPMEDAYFCKDGSVLICMTYRDWNPKAFETREAVRGWLAFVEALALKCPKVVTHGVSFLTDCEGMGWSNFDPEMEKVFVHVLQDSFPIRMKRFFMINSPAILKAILAIMKPFMQKKMRERLYVCHKDDLTKDIPVQAIPVAYRGQLQTTTAESVARLRS